MVKHVLLSVLAVGALGGLIVQRRCAPPVPVAVQELWGARRDSWTGRSVEVTGELKVFAPGTPGEHYAIEEDGYRVGVPGTATPPPGTLVGRRVRARGVFVFSEKAGGALESPSLVPAR